MSKLLNIIHTEPKKSAHNFMNNKNIPNSNIIGERIINSIHIPEDQNHSSNSFRSSTVVSLIPASANAEIDIASKHDVTIIKIKKLRIFGLIINPPHIQEYRRVDIQAPHIFY